MMIENEELLTNRFGRWPSFHDAEIVRAKFERQGDDAPYLECDIHVFEMTPEVDATGHYVLKNHTLVTIRFADIDLEDFTGWNHQNVLWNLVIASVEEDSDRPIQVELPSTYGCYARLKCRSVKVIKAEDFVECH